MVNLKKRKRQVNLETLSDEQLEQIWTQIGDKIRNILDNAVEEANELSKPYGFKVKMQFVAEPLNKEQ